MASGSSLKHRKPKAARKEEELRFRVTDAQKARFMAAAAKATLDLSAWMRQALTQKADELLGPQESP